MFIRETGQIFKVFAIFVIIIKMFSNFQKGFLAQPVARKSHNLKVASSNLAEPIFCPQLVFKDLF